MQNICNLRICYYPLDLMIYNICWSAECFFFNSCMDLHWKKHLFLELTWYIENNKMINFNILTTSIYSSFCSARSKHWILDISHLLFPFGLNLTALLVCPILCACIILKFACARYYCYASCCCSKIDSFKLQV